jgi:hypothetical protein
MTSLTTAGRRYALAHRDSIVADVAIQADRDQRHGTNDCTWPIAFQQTSIEAINERAAA